MAFLNKEGLEYFWQQIVARLGNKVDKEELTKTLNMVDGVCYMDAGTISEEGVGING